MRANIIWFCILAALLMSAACSDDSTSPPRGCVASDDPAPRLSLDDLNGEKYVLADDACQSMVLLGFGAVWCPACREGVDWLQSMHDEFGDDLKVMAVNVLEDPKRVRAWYNSNDVTFRVLLDTVGSYARLWDVDLIPTYVLISREGEVVARVNGLENDLLEELRAEIATRLE